MSRIGVALIPKGDEPHEVPELVSEAEDVEGSESARLTKDSFYEIADAEKLSRKVAGRSWNMLTVLYSRRFFTENGDLSRLPQFLHWIPEEFRYPPLEYETVPEVRARDSLDSYAKRLNHLRPESLGWFMDLVDARVSEFGTTRTGLPDRYGEGCFNFLHITLENYTNPS